MNAFTVPGLVVDSQGRLAFAVKSDVNIGVCTDRFEHLDGLETFNKALFNCQWVVVFNRPDAQIFMISPGFHVQPFPTGASPEANESAQFAIELALSCWPNWGKDYRGRFSPRRFVPYASRVLDEEKID